ncbi:phosphotransferase family enzyme [Cryobacterium psychrophilum]|uniref:Macrolide 2'-phosphotransferase n=1 Tax=Cryobacterium psychrophilum TaxID=41988 RepID=A0A4Y8KPU4_9MICO|nr:phosphotransferase family enzyme [Cryobacterium psychrophilum]TFD80798.1 macrolide 2'-phosphotransferase [Cryobacterium psychrophilum]
MARSHLTLAALATSAVSGLDVARTRRHSSGAHGLFDSALIVCTDDRTLIIRVPNTQAAETEQSSDLVALRALTAGNRSRLPFDVPDFVGQTPVSGTRAIVYELLAGDTFDADALTGHAGVAGSIGRAIAAIHGLPTAFANTAGLPQQTAEECRTAAIDVIDQTADTGYLPAALLRRWETATDDDALWQFAPTVIHGSMSADSFLITDDSVSGVLGWSGLCVGDPAHDLHWLLSARGDAAETAIVAYTTARQIGDSRITQRAMLYAELELARWLLHGTATRDQSIVDDAVVMLDGLVETVHSHTMHPLSPDTGSILDVSDVESMLNQTPRRPHDHDQHTSMHTDSYNFADLESGEFARLNDDDDASDEHSAEGRESGSTQSGGSAAGDEATGPITLPGTVAGSGTTTDDHARTRSSSE